MRFVTKQGDRVRKLFEHQKDLLDRIDICFTRHGMQIRALDSTQSCFVDINLVAESLETWELEPGETHRIGMTVDRLCRGMRSVTNGNVLSWSLPNAHGLNEFLVIETKSPTFGSGSMKVSTSEAAEHTYEVPEIEFQYAVSMPSPLMQSMCKNVSELQAENIIIECDGTHIRIGGDGDELNGFWTLGTNEGVSIKRTKNANEHSLRIRNVFPLKTLHYIAKAAAAGNSSEENIDIYLNANKPLVLKYDIGTIGFSRYVLTNVEDTSHSTYMDQEEPDEFA